MRNLTDNKNIKIEIIEGVKIPVFEIERVQEPWNKTQRSIEFDVQHFYRLYDMEGYSKALYIEKYDGVVFAKYGCYNFKREKPFFKDSPGSYWYDIFKIKYDGRFVSPHVDQSDSKSYDPGPKGDRLNNMNRTWYEND